MSRAVLSSPGLRREPVRQRLAVVSRLIAAVAGGYALSALAAAALALHLPLARADAAVAGTLVALVVFPVAVMGCFATRTAARAWAGVLVPAVAIGLVLLAGGGAP